MHDAILLLFWRSLAVQLSDVPDMLTAGAKHWRVTVLPFHAPARDAVVLALGRQVFVQHSPASVQAK